MISYLLLGEDGYDNREGFNCAHAVVKTLLVHVVTLHYFGNEIGYDTGSTQGFTEAGGLLDAHHTHGSCCVS